MNLYSKYEILLKCKWVDHISFLCPKTLVVNRTDFIFKERENKSFQPLCGRSFFNSLSTGNWYQWPLSQAGVSWAFRRHHVGSCRAGGQGSLTQGITVTSSFTHVSVYDLVFWLNIFPFSKWKNNS